MRTVMLCIAFCRELDSCLIQFCFNSQIQFKIQFILLNIIGQINRICFALTYTERFQMNHIPEGHGTTSIHHISVIKGSVQGKFKKEFISHYIDGNYLSFFLGAYRCEIFNSEFMFSDQLATVISGLYGPDVAEVLSFPNFFLFAYIVIYLAHRFLC